MWVGNWWLLSQYSFRENTKINPFIWNELWPTRHTWRILAPWKEAEHPFLSSRIKDGCLSLCTRQERGWFHRGGCIRSIEFYHQVVCCPVPSTPSSDWVKWEPLFCVTGLSIWAQTAQYIIYWDYMGCYRCPRSWMGPWAANPYQGGGLGWGSHPTQPLCDAMLTLLWEAQQKPELNQVLKHHCKQEKRIG